MTGSNLNRGLGG